jgi:hypothetical protein
VLQTRNGCHDRDNAGRLGIYMLAVCAIAYTVTRVTAIGSQDSLLQKCISSARKWGGGLWGYKLKPEAAA